MSHPYYQQAPVKAPLSRAVVFLVPFIIFVVGLIGAGVYGVRLVTEIQGEVGRDLFPGEVTWRVPGKGTYVLWYHPRNTFDGQRHDYPDELPDTVTIRVLDGATRKPLLVDESIEGQFSFTFNNDRSVSVGSFKAPEEMNVIFSVSGDESPRVFSMAPDKAFRFIKNLGMMIGLILGSTVLAFIAFIILYLIRKSPKPPLAHAGSPPPLP